MYASPSEIKMRSKISKDFVLTISNNKKDEAVYDVLCGICLDNLSIDQSIIKIEPVKKEITPNVPFSLLGLILSNGCSTMSVQNISPNSSKEFYVSVNGENIDINFRISFLIYQWELKPSQFRFPTTKEQFQNPPKNFNKFFDEKSSDKEKTVQGFSQEHKFTINPYFPDIKEATVLKAWFYRN